MFSPWYSWTIDHVALINNHSITGVLYTASLSYLILFNHTLYYVSLRSVSGKRDRLTVYYILYSGMMECHILIYKHCHLALLVKGHFWVLINGEWWDLYMYSIIVNIAKWAAIIGNISCKKHDIYQNKVTGLYSHLCQIYNVICPTFFKFIIFRSYTIV